MISDLEHIFSDSTKNMKRSAIREILKFLQKPEIISFGGGLPAPESFPVKELKQIFNELMDEEGPEALQYGATEGVQELRKILMERYQKEGLNIGIDNLAITTSSQQALYILGKIFLDKGDKVVCGLPSYLGGISAFRTFGADMHGIRTDEKGMRSDHLEEKLKEFRKQGTKPKFIYVIPDFQNPTGITMPESRRKEIINLAREYDVLIVEDNPYREIRFEGEPQRTIFELDNSWQVITLGSLSKTFSPGLRLGWAIGDKNIIDQMVVAKQSLDLCTPTLTQKLAARYIKEGYLDEHLKKTTRQYKRKRDNMIEAFRKYMPEGVTWNEPHGGLFLFLYLPEYMDSQKLFYTAIKKEVAFVMGDVFHCDGSGKNTLRINFSYVDEERATEGIKRLAHAIKEEMKTQ
ncbi:MAG: PLP-dependent aminotransferase family protein [Bacteroidales bacterium]|nr:PLP-dependent aminotransferase family protein [Bacteroidales bacterium]MBS3774032.1 PLP-dependent aminotransferase family protein [Bacteroidales bacterium]